MSDKHHISRQSDDEEEDLEILRLAALKSLHSKKETSATILAYHPTPVQRNIPTSAPPYSLTHLSAGAPYVNNDNEKRCYYIPSEHNIPSQRPLTNLIDNYDTRQRLEKLDINEPYVPQHVAPVNPAVPLLAGANGWTAEPTSMNNGYVPYVPHKTSESVGLGVTNVQLSPRSLAFVAENNDILMRRKGENISPNYIRSPCRSPCKSPSYRAPIPSYRSPSPVYRESPSRWSVTPPPKSKSRSPPPRNRLHHYSHRRSMSRSLPPSRGRSPVGRRRSASRSPPSLAPSSRHASPYRYSPRSPKYSNPKRVTTRSPPPRTRNKTPPRRLSRSPIPPPRHSAKSKSPLNIIARRRSSPAPRHSNKSRQSPIHQKRSSSHGHDTESRHTHRPRSPQNNMPNTARSRSRSPVRKFSRRSRDRNIPSSQPIRRRSPYNNGRRRPEVSTNGYRNRGRKRSASPVSSSRRKISRSKSPERSRREENRPRKPERNMRKMEEVSRSARGGERGRNVENNARAPIANGNQEIKESTDAKQNVASKKPEIQDSLGVIAEDSQDKSENIESESEKKQDTSSEEANEEESSDESDDDGIDLFPSDESESENEGRFKLGTSRRERDESIPTLSFTKLGESSVPDLVKDLKDVGASNHSKSSISGKDDRDKERSTYDSRRRDDRFRKSDNNRSRNDRRRLNGSNNISRREYEEAGRSDDKRRAEKPMFKSTFQAVENDVSKSSGKSTDEKDVNERKSSIQLKRKFHNKDDRDSPEKGALSEKLSSVVTSSPNTGGNAGTGGKKPIHLRLGAMTNTFKAPKKSSTWSSSDKV